MGRDEISQAVVSRKSVRRMGSSLLWKGSFARLLDGGGRCQSVVMPRVACVGERLNCSGVTVRRWRWLKVARDGAGGTQTARHSRRMDLTQVSRKFSGLTRPDADQCHLVSSVPIHARGYFIILSRSYPQRGPRPRGLGWRGLDGKSFYWNVRITLSYF